MELQLLQLTVNQVQLTAVDLSEDQLLLVDLEHLASVELTEELARVIWEVEEQLEQRSIAGRTTTYRSSSDLVRSTESRRACHLPLLSLKRIREIGKLDP